jgi:hypothetical protein
MPNEIARAHADADNEDAEKVNFIHTPTNVQEEEEQQQQQQQQQHYRLDLAKHLRESATFHLVLRRIALMLIAIISLTLANALCLFTEAFNDGTERTDDGEIDYDGEGNADIQHNLTTLAELLVKLLQESTTAVLQETNT